MDGLTVYEDAPELAALTPESLKVLGTVKKLLLNAHLVGGSVRDLLLGQPGRDLDVLTEMPVGPLADALHNRLGGELSCHAAFLTCSLELPTLTLDLATTRTESYPHPGALPVVRAGSLAPDLHRRDFSVNTFALRLSEPHTLVSVPGAKDDLSARRLRVLHARSFVDDPTRIVRGARLAGRLGFSYDVQTRSALEDALAAQAHAQVSPARLKNELLLTLAERSVAPALTYLAESGALAALYGLHDTPLVAQLDALGSSVAVPAESYLLALLLGISEKGAAAHVSKFSWPRRMLTARTRLSREERPRTDAERVVRRALGQPQRSVGYPQLRGSDVLSLGLPAGPEVGRVLSLVEGARLHGQVASFADELELAKWLVQRIQENA